MCTQRKASVVWCGVVQMDGWMLRGTWGEKREARSEKMSRQDRTRASSWLQGPRLYVARRCRRCRRCRRRLAARSMHPIVLPA
jgi:hypothetical protein